MNFSLPQRERAELLDTHVLPLREVQRSLGDIARINALTGANFMFGRAFWALVSNANLQRATLLDVGTGRADLPRILLRESRKQNVQISAFGLDINAAHLQMARANLPEKEPIHLLRGDAFGLPLANESVDFVVSTLFLHHFRPAQIANLLQEAQRVARVGVLMSDLTRNRASLCAFRLARPILARSWITRHDAEVSIRRGYTAGEMREIVAPLGFQVEEPIPFRQIVRWTRCNANG